MSNSPAWQGRFVAEMLLAGVQAPTALQEDNPHTALAQSCLANGAACHLLARQCVSAGSVITGQGRTHRRAAESRRAQWLF